MALHHAKPFSFRPRALQSRLPAGQWDASQLQEFGARVQDT